MNTLCKQVLLLADSLRPGSGGISRVARLMARVLAEEERAGQIRLQGLVLSDDPASQQLVASLRSAGGSRWRFAGMALQSSRDTSHYIYDACHLAQVHRLPFLRRRPYLTYIHGIEVWKQTKKGYLNSARRAHLLLSNSDFTRRTAEQLHGNLGHARVCWLATETDDRPESLPPASRKPSEVLVVGRLQPGRDKGHRALIGCWPTVLRAAPDAHLTIVGDGPDKSSLQRLAARAQAADRITFAGALSDCEVESRYAHAGVFAMPSRTEGFGLVYAEAMRHALPVIASIHDAAPEVIADGLTGFTINLDRPQELADRLIYLLRNPEQAALLGANGQRRWAEHFCFSAFRNRFRPFLTEFLSTFR